MARGLCELFAGIVESVSGGHQFLAHLGSPLLDKSVAVSGRRGKLVLAFDQAVAVGIEVAQDLDPLIGGGEQIEAAAELARRQARSPIFDFLGDLYPVVIIGEVGLALANRSSGLWRLAVLS